MIGIALCIAAFVATFLVARRSLVAGLCALLSVGYFYGIIRANVPQTASHFIFDSAVLGLYAVQLFRSSTFSGAGSTALRWWVAVLCGWPIVLLAVPTQDPLIQFVGLRAAILFLPLLLLGARLKPRDLDQLAVWCALLNLVAFAFAASEFAFGLERFFPRNEVTALIYWQHDVVGYKWARIPATLANAHSYAGTMVATLPLLLGAWLQRRGTRGQRILIVLAVLAALLGVFAAAARMHTVIALVLLIVATLSGRIKLSHRVAWVTVILLVGWLVSKEVRLQRFTSLQDTDAVSNRVASSANYRFFDAIAAKPLGNGLGGGGTNIPYFLRQRLNHPMVIENEYAKIALEQGIPGLALWILFVFWAFGRRASQSGDGWRLGRRLAWFNGALYFGTAWIGLGLLSSIPHAALLLLSTGWVIMPERGFPVPRFGRVTVGSAGVSGRLESRSA